MWHGYDICMGPDFLSEIIRFIDVFSHLSTLYVVLHVRKIATQANNWIESVVVSRFPS